MLMSDFDGCITVILGTYHMERTVRYRKKGQELSQVNYSVTGEISGACKRWDLRHS